MEKSGVDKRQQKTKEKPDGEESPMILEEIEVEELFIDGICGVY
jgi:mycofactocin precursor